MFRSRLLANLQLSRIVYPQALKPQRHLYHSISLDSNNFWLTQYLNTRSFQMHYSWTVVVVALVAQCISASPLGRRGFIVADVNNSPVDDLVKRNYAALDTPDGKKRDVRQSLFSRVAEPSIPSSDLHVRIPNGKYVKRVAEGELVDHEIVGPGDELVDDVELGLDRLVSKDPDDDQTGITVSEAAPEDIPPNLLPPAIWEPVTWEWIILWENSLYKATYGIIWQTNPRSLAESHSSYKSRVRHSFLAVDWCMYDYVSGTNFIFAATHWNVTIYVSGQFVLASMPSYFSVEHTGLYFIIPSGWGAPRARFFKRRFLSTVPIYIAISIDLKSHIHRSDINLSHSSISISPLLRFFFVFFL